MNFLKSFSIKKLLYNKKFTIPFSILMSFAIWLSITVEQKPTMERNFSDASVSINLENTVVAENNMSIIGDISKQKFTVAVRGPSYIVSALKNTDFNLYASAAEVDAPGEYNLKVIASKTTEGYEILSINPPNIKVSFDYIETKDFKINAIAEGVAASEGLIAEAGVVGGTEKDTITITGPRTVINRIENVIALASVNKTLSASETFDASIVLYDAEGNVIDDSNLTFSESNVRVTVPISKKKTVSVKVDLANLPSGFKKDSLKTSIDYPTVTVIGTPETIDKINEVMLSAIDITTVAKDKNVFTVTPKLPEGVRLLDAIENFTVTFDFNGYVEKTLTISKFKYSGLGSGLSAKDGVSIKNVRIFGPRAEVSKITASNVYANIDLTDKKAGEHTVTATIGFENSNNVWAVGLYKTTVVIK